ncbi:MAG: hypothetical protein WCV71_03770 [Patescibacteria group bacterium]|jgi:hypothetical protein
MREKLLVTSLMMLVMVSFTGCKRTVVQQSGELTESAVVDEVIFSPSSHGSSVGPTMSGDGGIGIAVTSVSIPEKYAVVFRCQHGKFVVQGTSQKYKELWERLIRGQAVTVYYKETYRVVYEGEELLSRELIGYDFLTAR